MIWKHENCKDGLCAEKLDQLLEHIPFSIVVTDKEANIKYVNNAFETSTGYTKQEAYGQNPRILKSNLQPDSVYKEMWDILTQGKIWTGEFQNKKKNGQIFWEKFSVIPIKNEIGEIVEYLAIKKDMTEQKIIEDIVLKQQKELIIKLESQQKTKEAIKVLYNELSEKNKKLETLDNMKNEFISVVSHELRTPLTIIREGAAIVKDQILGSVNAEQEDMLDSVLQNVDRLTRIINDLLDISKIEAGKIDLQKEKIDLASFFAEICEEFKIKAAKKGIELIEQIKENLIAEVDKERIRQVVLNLLNNAWKFTPQGGKIYFKAERNENNIYAEIIDTGIGINEENQKKLFEKFHQIGRVDGSGEKGTGLGLSIAKKLVEIHGGTIGVES